MSKGHNVPPPTPPAAHGDMDPEEREAQTRFLRERWDALAALAWERYTVEGRGAIILSVISTAGSGKTMRSMPPSERCRRRGWPDADTARMVAAYLPEQEIVIAVPRENGGNSTYRMRGPIPPPEAYRRRE